MSYRDPGVLRALTVALTALMVGLLAFTYSLGAPSGAPSKETDSLPGAPSMETDRLPPAGRHSRQGDMRKASAPPLTLEEVQVLAFDHARARGVDSLLVLGVILTENPWLDPSIVSRHGSVGLMQVTPRFWLGRFPECGDDLTDPNTNICYGTAILALLLSTSRTPREALLRYNGCRGIWLEKYPTCLDYPDTVTERG